MLLLILPQLVKAEPFSEWKPIDKTLFVATTVATVIDWGQTRYVVKHPEQFHETNPLFGTHPTMARVNTIMAARLIANYALAEAFPQYRTTILGVTTSISFYFVARNAQIGVHMHF